MASPVQAAEAQKMIAMLAGGGPGGPGGAPGGAPGMPPGGPGGPGGPPTPSPQGMALGQATQQLDGANPQGLADLITQINDALAQAYLTAAMRIPDAAGDIAAARKQLEAAKKKCAAASQVLQQVRPIANSAGVGPMPGATPGGAGPDISSLLGM